MVVLLLESPGDPTAQGLTDLPHVPYRSQLAGNAIDENPTLELSRMGFILRQKGEVLAQLQQHKAAESPALYKVVCTKDWQRQQEETFFLPLVYGCVCICSLILTSSTGVPMPTEMTPATMLARVMSVSDGALAGSPWRSWLRKRCTLLNTPNTTEL